MKQRSTTPFKNKELTPTEVLQPDCEEFGILDPTSTRGYVPSHPECLSCAVSNYCMIFAMYSQEQDLVSMVKDSLDTEYFYDELDTEVLEESIKGLVSSLSGSNPSVDEVRKQVEKLIPSSVDKFIAVVVNRVLKELNNG